jgi:hypothetical protein
MIAQKVAIVPRPESFDWLKLSSGRQYRDRKGAAARPAC